MDAIDAYRVLRQTYPSLVTRRGHPAPCSPLVLSGLEIKFGREGACEAIRAVISDAELADALCRRLTDPRTPNVRQFTDPPEE